MPLLYAHFRLSLVSRMLSTSAHWCNDLSLSNLCACSLLHCQKSMYSLSLLVLSIVPLSCPNSAAAQPMPTTAVPAKHLNPAIL